VAVAGGLVLIAGFAMIVLPGPAIVVIPLGLALLATEFPWAARLLRHLRAWTARMVARVRRPGPQVIASTPQR
jgi:tellurite resistance protein TerC